jgi:hypothetical protein
MLRYQDSRRLQRRVPSLVPMHKFAVGSRVLCSAPNSRPKQSHFQVTRLLPDGGLGLQYRIRSEFDGMELVVAESALRLAPTPAIAGNPESAARRLFAKPDS